MQNCLHLVSELKKPVLSKNISKNSTKCQEFQVEENTKKFLENDLNWTNDKSKLNEVNLNLAKLLIDSGCSFNHKDFDSHETPVFKAILANNYDLVKLFISEGCDMSIRNLFGNDVLSRSIQLGRFKIARLLILADSPIRIYSCFYKIPSLEDFNRETCKYNSNDFNDDYDLDFAEYKSENFLQYSIGKYEEFLAFLHKYTQEPRSLLDLSRLALRSQMVKPISQSLTGLGQIPKQIRDLVRLEDF